MNYVALLRGVNVGGNKTVPMDRLKALAADIGLSKPRTLLNSGNLLFASERPPADLEELLEDAIARVMEMEVDCLVRGEPELGAVISANPFPVEAETDPGHLIVVFLKDEAQPGPVEALQASVVGREVIRAGGGHLYITYPDGIGRSKLTNALIEKRIGARGTARNWNTVLKLHDMLRD